MTFTSLVCCFLVFWQTVPARCNSNSPTQSCFDVLRTTQLALFNLSHVKESFLSCFVQAILYTLPKKPSLDADLISDYWPIPNLNFILNFLDVLLKVDLRPSCLQISLLLPFQLACHIFHSTKVLLSVHSNIIRSIRSKPVHLLFFIHICRRT